ncbi:hypothetical protein GGU45_001429 [Niabella hirudinis]
MVFYVCFFRWQRCSPVLDENFKQSEKSYANLPDSLKREMELDDFQENIKAVYTI